MIENIVKKYLEKTLQVPVYMEEPETPPGSYVRIEKTGGRYSEHLNYATIVIQSYGKSLEEAALLNEEVKKSMLICADQKPISRCELNADYNYTDTTTRRYRYQAVFDFIYY